MTLTKGEEYRLLHLLLDIGKLMLRSGGEVNRVENTLSLIGKAYGATETNVLVITTTIIITMEFSDGNLITESCRIEKSCGNMLWQLEKINALSRKCCENPISIDLLEEEVRKCERPVNKQKFYIGSLIVAGAFAVLFGGSIFDAAAAMIFALVICLFQSKLSDFFPNNIVFNTVCSFVVGIIICLFAKIIPFINADNIITGDIMLLIPGVAFTNAIRDLFVGDTVSGLMRLIESLLWAAGLAVGFMLAVFVVGGISL